MPHVKLVTDGIEGFTSAGIRTKDATGSSYDVDIVILATGFSVMDSSKAVVATGRDRKRLHEVWKDEPRLYLGTAHVSCTLVVLILFRRLQPICYPLNRQLCKHESWAAAAAQRLSTAV